MSQVQCDIVSAEEEIYSGMVEMVICTGTLGDLGIAPGHAPLITELAPGPIRLLNKGEEEKIYYISGGYLEVQPKMITVLANTALRAGDLDEAAALEAQKRAEQELSDKSADLDYSLAVSRLAQAAAQLRTIREIKRALK